MCRSRCSWFTENSQHGPRPSALWANCGYQPGRVVMPSLGNAGVLSFRPTSVHAVTLRTRQDAPSRSAGIVGDRWWRAGIVFSALLALSACAGEDVASGPGEGGDYPDTNYSVQAQDRSTFEHCEYQDVFYVSMAYQLGDGVAATRGQRESELLPELRACLATLGYDIPAEATMAELIAEVPADAPRAHTECRWGSG